ncbi:hypothetical protein [Xanthomonas phage Olaya]|nr:hypothetical protein [Xanthomonas phage Olaya]QTZ82427.1 hypothetical protein [Xanthomonas phage Bolivar]QTZ82528.1 hypothetical protein [Xanthomonas phage Usaquen]QTZ82541.1 hypothetical protein [Xanthomonas phage Alcala]QTZ82594.1 hypothetical protein [Xanthomonas phage Fontebon]QTZ82692.1 hypothetical protein [Xanthomonas phage Soumapaz]CAA2366749.1 hypothetical protein [Xylella phage Usme]
MILDQLLYFSDNQAVLADGISNVIDRGANAPVLANFSPGFAGDLFLVVQTGTAFTGATALEVKLASDSTADLATSPTTHVSTGAIPVANLGANKVVAVLPVPPGDYERYVGLIYDITGTGTAGTIRAFLTQTPGYYRKMAANNPQARN